MIKEEKQRKYGEEWQKLQKSPYLSMILRIKNEKYGEIKKSDLVLRILFLDIFVPSRLPKGNPPTYRLSIYT